MTIVNTAPSLGRRRQLRVLRALEHAQREVNGDKLGTLATLEESCWYELYPAGLRMEGIDYARQYYDHYFAHVRPAFREIIDHGIWENEDGVAFDVTATLEVTPAVLRTYRFLAVVVPGDIGVVGERIWCDEELARFLFGPAFGNFRPIDGYRSAVDAAER